jgi:putative nucleotidyltransferase with HDIG domain
LIILLSTGINQRRLYFDAHPKVQSLSADFANRMQARLEERDEKGFFFGILHGKFIRNGKYLIGPSIAGRNLIDFSEKLGCGGFLFRREVTSEEVAAFFRAAAKLKEKTANLEESMALFRSEGIVNIILSSFYREGGPGEGEDGSNLVKLGPGMVEFDFSELDENSDRGMGKSVADELAPLLPIFQTMFETVATNNIHINSRNDVNLGIAIDVSNELFEVSDKQTMDIMNLMRYPDYDSYTIGHSVRVSTLALTVGREMGWPEHLLPELATAGLLHDVGKAKVPDEILYKPGKLDPDERKIAESHAAIGAQLLLAKGDASPLVIAGAWGHHIRHDAGGYPPLPEWALKSPIASLLQVCDVFEALTAARPYKSPMPPRRAFEIILKDRTAYDPVALTALVRAIGLYPPGSEIALSDGSRGYVTANGPTWEEPTVRVTRDTAGSPLDKEHQYIVKLHEEEEIAVADFLMVGLDPGSVDGMEDAQGEKQDPEEKREKEVEMEQAVEDILEESTM